MAKKTMTFEEAMERLEEIRRLLENGEEPLDSALKLYEEGIALIRECSDKLENAALTVKALQMRPDGKAELADFGGDAEN